MAETKQSTTAAPKAAAPSAPLGPAAESGDPAVHKLLADLDIARRNDNADGVNAAVKALADLGYSAA